MRVAGLAPVNDIPGLENLDVTKLVNGHMAYRAAMPKLMREVGWEVESDEFTEIEDPDPENHEKRQRELIRELDEARKEAETKPEKKRFGFFKRGKLAEKKGWETYDERSKEGGNGGGDDFSTSAAEGLSGNVLFDIDAIKKELESEQIEVKQLESTLPPMKLDLNGNKKGDTAPQNPYSTLHSSKSYDHSLAYRPNNNAASNSSLPINVTNPYNQGYDEYNLSQESIARGSQLSGAHSTPKVSSDAPRPSVPSSPQPSHQQLSPRFPNNDSSMPTSPLKQMQSSNSCSPPQRPELKSSRSSPAVGPVGFEHNAWADEEEEFGEREVKMTF